jgi:hypothetical protein
MMATAKYVGSETRIAVIVQNFHIQDQGKFLLKGSHPALLHCQISSLPFLFTVVKKTLQWHQWCHEAMQCSSFVSPVQ